MTWFDEKIPQKFWVSNVPRNSVRKAFLYAWGMVLSTGIKGSRVHPLGFILSDILILKQLKHTPLLNKECRNFEITWLDLRKDSHFNAWFSFTWLWNSSSIFLELIYGKMSCLLCKCPAHCEVIPHWPITTIIQNRKIVTAWWWFTLSIPSYYNRNTPTPIHS